MLFDCSMFFRVAVLPGPIEPVELQSGVSWDQVHYEHGFGRLVNWQVSIRLSLLLCHSIVIQDLICPV